MANSAERLTARRAKLVLLLAMIGVVGWWLWPRGAPPVATAIEQSLIVQRQPFSATLSFAGTIVPGQGIAITAPFDGAVKAMHFVYSDRVARGQALLELDAAELDQSRNEAESAFLKAAQAAAEMEGWTGGVDVSRAQRAVTAARIDLRDSTRKLAETKALLDRGLVARSEYEGQEQTQRSHEMAVTAAREDLANVLKRGQGANRRVATLELQNARARLDRLNAQFGNAVLRAPDDGIIVRPPVEKEGASGAVHVGQRLTKGQLIGTIVAAGGLGVAFKLDEADVNQLRVGQAAVVTGAGFNGLSLTGRIANVAGKASFEATVRLDPLTREQAARVRVGMTAMVVVTTYSAPAAIVVPPEALKGAAPVATVAVKDRARNAMRDVSVRLGRITPMGVEILSGVRAGDEIVWTVAPTASAIGGSP
jgi:HlyD family secretion protein